MKQTRNCLFCTHFDISIAEADWSEVTPGNEADIWCQDPSGPKFYLSLGPGGDDQDKITRSMLKATTCESFELSDLARELDVEIVEIVEIVEKEV